MSAEKTNITPATAHVLSAIQIPAATRATVAEVLAAELNHDVDWPLVNRAIMKRWSRSGLLYIKRRAWKQVTG